MSLAAGLGEACGPARVAKPVGKQHQVGWIVEGADMVRDLVLLHAK